MRLTRKQRKRRMPNPISGIRGFLADAVDSDAVGSFWDAVTSPFTRLGAKAIDPGSYPSPAWDEGMIGVQPKGPLTTIYHGTDDPHLITKSSSPGYLGMKGYGEGRFTFASPDYNTAKKFGDTVLSGKIDTDSFNKAIYTLPYKGYTKESKLGGPVPAPGSDLVEPQVLLKSEDAYDVLKEGKVGSAVPRYDFGPYRGIISPDEITTDIPKESVIYKGPDNTVPHYDIRKKLEKGIIPSRKVAGWTARLAGPAQYPLAASAMSKHLANNNYPAFAGAALSMFPGGVGLAGLGLETFADNVSLPTAEGDPRYSALAARKEAGPPPDQPLDASRTYTWDMPDLPEILWDVNQAGPEWNKTPGGAKILSDLNLDKDYRNKLVQMELNRDESSLPSAGDQLLTTTDIDKLSSRMMGGGFYGPGRQAKSLVENLWESAIKGETEDLKNWGRGFVGSYKGLSPFEIMYADEGLPSDTFARSPLDGFRTDDQTRFLDRTSSIRSPLDGFGSPIKDIPEGTFPEYLGPLGDPPTRDDWFQDNPDAFTVQEDAEASLYPIGATIGGDSLLEEPTNIDNINTLLRNTLVPMERITETVEPLPSGPEEMQPQPKKKKKQETGGPSASDLRRLAEKSRKQAEEKEDRIRKEAKKSKAKVKHDDKKSIAQTKSRADKKKKEADALQKAHDNFIKEQERLWRAKQQASMPKSWAFF